MYVSVVTHVPQCVHATAYLRMSEYNFWESGSFLLLWVQGKHLYTKPSCQPLRFSDIYLLVQKAALTIFWELSSHTLGACPCSPQQIQTKVQEPEDTKKAHEILALARLSTPLIILSHLGYPLSLTSCIKLFKIIFTT